MAEHPPLGPGILSKALFDAIFHDRDLYSLFSVEVFDIPCDKNPLSPTLAEARTSIPHPHAFYCDDLNCWVILDWRSSSVLPPLARPLSTPLPDHTRRMQIKSCIEGEGPSSRPTYVSHHWHRYKRAVHATQLDPLLIRNDTALDLYVCCQCSTYCLVSEVIPGVISTDLLSEFFDERWRSSASEKLKPVLLAWDFILTTIENRLWKNETRALPISGPQFKRNLVWTDTARQIFEAIGFKTGPSPENQNETVLLPPPIDPVTPEGRESRKKLLRAWAEITASLSMDSDKFDRYDFTVE
ncbi:hypothetical protein WOLCODRAFT_148527 [Wolfiporia cocos MD-104 SS10]|uniref:Uncharacterized protein n=1 Tax=Wolfiporia cocos (strain MD-104) TaxID=742152 RepID=A0A2H3IWZ0_WOLCO|nr:hypothetical protein WOLCODRAFT_148527 [Wolfiporia cocos MD-104 SS10]